jgi:ParB-like chromosome segregation protein Spo0J
MNAVQIEIRLLPIAKLKPAPYNPRRVLKPDSPAYKKLAASLREFGLVEPLIWNESTGYVVGGHARLRILKEMGVAEAPVSVVRLSPEREKALNVILNNREAQSRYDPMKLADLLGELQELPELELTGFDRTDLNALRLEPLPELPAVEETGRIEVTLETDVATFERFSERLDELIGEFDVTCHIRR